MKFKVGDKVKIVRDTEGNPHNIPLGSVGKVADFYENGQEFPILVLLESDVFRGFGWNELAFCHYKSNRFLIKREI